MDEAKRERLKRLYPILSKLISIVQQEVINNNIKKDIELAGLAVSFTASIENLLLKTYTIEDIRAMYMTLVIQPPEINEELKTEIIKEAEEVKKLETWYNKNKEEKNGQ
jgi:predicted DNA-binding protein YlxM (UPF0122 family)